MAIIVSDSSFEPCPAGMFDGVCVDVIDRGIETTQFGERHAIRFLWQVNLKSEETGKRFQLRQDYTASLNEKANLRKMLESWRGKRFTGKELEAFDVELCVGTFCQIQVMHKEMSKGGIWASPSVILPPGANFEKFDYEYERVAEAVTGSKDDPFVATDEDVPF